MSFSKNENTFPTLSLVPIVLAAGTVYIGRRYFATLLLSRSSSDTTSNAVTRRRRFPKNPFPRRPLPIVNAQHCDCVKKSTLEARDIVTNTAAEDSMPAGSNRRLPRNNKPTTNATTSAPVTPVESCSSRYSTLNAPYGGTIGGGGNGDMGVAIAPKHIPFPNTPVDHELLFELIMFLFTFIAASLQFVHLYRSVWWLPHAYTNQSLNFYLIDKHLVVFIFTILARRILYAVSWWVLQRMILPKLLPLCKNVLKSLTLVTTLSILAWCGYHIVQSQPLVNTFYLCYPISVYVILFGVNISPFLELITPTEVSYLDGNPLHSCTSNAATIRTEVEILRMDFNIRMKQILFNSVLNAYYVGFVPCCFAQSFLYYDVYWATQHLAFVWLGCFTMYTVHVVPARYCDVLHRTALHLGAWNRVDGTNFSTNPIKGCQTSLPSGAPTTWNPESLYPMGVVVKHSREYYKSISPCNAADPSNVTHSRFYTMFYNPSIALCSILGLQLCLVLVQLGLLIRSSHWYHIMSLALLLFVNYYTLFKLARDYLISWKVYKNLKRNNL